MPGNDADLALLHEAALAAGQIALHHRAAGAEVWAKSGDQGPVTQADLDIDQMLHDRLRAARPGYGWLSEERADNTDRLGREHVFIVDPIDGTRAYVDGQKGFAHALAVLRASQPVAAVVHLPAAGLTYGAARGGGAWLNGTRISVSARKALTGARMLATRSQLDPSHWPGGAPFVDRHFRPSLAWRLALVAEGRFDAMLSLRKTWHWDIAAGALLVAEAGGVVTDGAGRALRFNTEDPRSDGVIAAAGPVHQALIARRNPKA
ncbi:MAG: 3'(2'),5'-bisphosphate nucleotidase CysQ [Rhodobacteraceae bacterium]|nr:3'(2'),5'-bisphosphate nucleotidase CysQ [Paracoccaceae bacterium]